MIRVNAPEIFAKMIQNDTFWDRTLSQFINESMSIMGFDLAVEGRSMSSIALRDAIASPKPATIFCDLNLFLNSRREKPPVTIEWNFIHLEKSDLSRSFDSFLTEPVAEGELD